MIADPPCRRLSRALLIGGALLLTTGAGIAACSDWSVRVPAIPFNAQYFTYHEIAFEFDRLWVLPLSHLLPAALGVLVLGTIVLERYARPKMATPIQTLGAGWFLIAALCIASHAAGNHLYVAEWDAFLATSPFS